MLAGIAHLVPGGRVPAIGDARKRAVERLPQPGHDGRQRIAEILVLAAAEAVARHHDAAAEVRFGRIQPGEPVAVRLRNESLDHRAALRVELLADARPFDRVDRVQAAARSRSSNARLRRRPQR